MVVAEQLNYDYTPVLTPKYEYLYINPASGINSIAPFNQNGGMTTQFQIPANIVNLSRSYIEFSLDVSATAAKFNWAHLDSFLLWQSIKHYSRGGFQFYINDFLPQYMNMAARRVTRVDDMLTWGKPYNNGIGYFNGLSACNQANGANTDNVVRPDATVCATSYLEPRYLMANQTAVNTAGPNIKFRIFLNAIPDSILSQDKDSWFAGEVTNLDIVWSSIANFLFCATTNTAPGDLTGGVQADFAGVLNIKNIGLRLAVETDQKCIDDVMRQFHAGQLSLIAPHPTITQIAQTGPMQGFSLNLYRTNGLFCKKVYYTAYTSANVRAYRWYHSNQAGNGATGVRVASFQSYIDEKPLQFSPYDCTNGDDYFKQQQSLRGSCILSDNEHYYNWVHVDDFTNYTPQCDRPKVIDGVTDSQFFAGYPITKDTTWRLQATMGPSVADLAGANYQSANHVAIAIGLRHLSITSAGFAFTM
jgi:hypothetical protein